MSDTISAHATYQSGVERLATLRLSMADAKEQVDNDFADLLTAASKSSDEQIARLAEAIIYTDEQIELKSSDPDTGVKAKQAKVKETAIALREAARTGDARAAESSLAEAEDELAEVKTDVKLLKKARREHIKQFNTLLKGIV